MTKPETYAARLQAPIYQGGLHRANINTQFYRAAAARYQLRGTEQEILLAAISAWYRLYRDTQVFSLSKQNEALLEEQLRVMNRRKDLGFATGTDVARTLSRLSQARRRTVGAGESRAISLYNFQDIIGVRPAEDLTYEDTAVQLPTSELEAVALASERNPGIIGTKLSVEASRFGIDLARSSAKPTLVLGMSSTHREAFANVDSLSTQSQIDLTLTLPVSGLRTTKAAVRAAKARYNAGVYGLESEMRSLESRTRAAWIQHKSAVATLPIVATELGAAELSVTGLEKLVETGQAAVSDLLDARRELLDAQITEVSAQVDADLTSYALLARVGELSPDQLSLDTQEDPEADDEFDLKLYRILFGGLMPWLGTRPDDDVYRKATSSVEN